MVKANCMRDTVSASSTAYLLEILLWHGIVPLHRQASHLEMCFLSLGDGSIVNGGLVADILVSVSPRLLTRDILFF